MRSRWRVSTQPHSFIGGHEGRTRINYIGGVEETGLLGLFQPSAVGISMSTLIREVEEGDELTLFLDPNELLFVNDSLQ